MIRLTKDKKRGKDVVTQRKFEALKKAFEGGKLLLNWDGGQLSAGGKRLQKRR